MDKSWFSISARSIPGSKIANFDGTKAEGAERRVGEISIHGPIADVDYWGDGVAKAADFIAAVKDLGEVEEIELSIHSPGGMVTEGWAIYNALKNHKARVTARVEGMAASMASVVAMAADAIEMPRNAYLMIHNVSGGALGEIRDMERALRSMQQMQDDIVAVYSDRTGLPVQDIEAMMDDETWMNGERAHELGFADFVLDEVKAAAVTRADIKNFSTVPVQLVATAIADAPGDQEPEADVASVDPEPENADTRAEADEETPTEEEHPNPEATATAEPGDQEPEATEEAATVDPEPESTDACAAEGTGGLRGLLARITGKNPPTAEVNAAVNRAKLEELNTALATLRDEVAAQRDLLEAIDQENGEAEAEIVATLASYAPEALENVDRDEATIGDLVTALCGELKAPHVIAAEIVAEQVGLTAAEADEDLPCPVDAGEVEPLTCTRAEFDSMSFPERRKFLKEGGRINTTKAA